eukprot:TRINITY_DN4873_c0_g1_i1.p1 TRINITY_DN4873_c0_g1~~TRINITY_DN4873_c0_g1_i1.p1  ORF type:complete len:283 (+),score=56.06 TRINITY_DN4873_c0_g1_i1:754-1602(+)
MDVYMPPRSDKRTSRPAVVFVHGGAFIRGDKAGFDVVSASALYAMTGYVVFAINYRLTPTWDLVAHRFKDGITPLTMAYEDLQLALRVVTKSASDYGVDPNRIVVAGHSAGAITALYYGYAPGAANVVQENEVTEKVQAVLSLAGEAKAEAMCARINPKTLEPSACGIESPPGPDFLPKIVSAGFVNRLKQRPVPLMQVHGTLDNIVPYKNDFALHEAAQQAKFFNKFIPLPGMGHMDAIMTLQNLSNGVFTNTTEFFARVLTLTDGDCPTEDANDTVSVVV